MDTDRTALEAGAVAALLAPVVKFTSDPFGLREKSNYTPSQPNLPFDTRIHHFTWAYVCRLEF
ncbi:hypothetical protein ABW21_db0201377 [Orbilia brochopaga]|nr:hypothetical protein ABW21_db0201377 [Drechslerella brochopaga]